MLLQHILLFLLNKSLLLFNLLLFLYYAEELVTFLLSLLSEASFTLEELSLARIFHITKHLLLVLEVTALLFTSLALTLFKCTLSTECIDLSLTIGSLLLKLPESGNLALFLFLDTLDFSCLLLFALSLSAVVLNDLLLKVLLFALALVLHINRALVGLLDLSDHTERSLLLCFQLSVFFLFDLLGLADHLLHLTLTHLLLLDALQLSLLNLIDDHQRALLLGSLALDLTLLLELKGFQTLNLHHEVEALLFFDPLLFEALGLLELAVADCDNLGVEHHLIHVLDIVMLLVHHLLSLGEETLSLLFFEDLLL